MRKDEIDRWEQTLREELAQLEDALPELEEQVAVETLRSVMRVTNQLRLATERLDRAQLRADTLRTALKGIAVLRRQGRITEPQPERRPELSVEAWLRRELAYKQDVDQLRLTAGLAGYDWSEVLAARDKIGAVAEFHGGSRGTCYWRLPEELAEQVRRELHPEEPRTAADWLQEQLEAGEVAVAELKERAEAAGFGWRTVERAKADLGVAAIRRGSSEGAWYWRLAEPRAEVAQ